MLSAKWRPFHLGLNVLKLSVDNLNGKLRGSDGDVCIMTLLWFPCVLIPFVSPPGYKFGQAAPYLMEAEVPIPTNAECNRQFYQGQVKAHHICAGNGNPNACSGDSGGPMSCEYNGVWYVAGVTSWGSLMCQGVPGVYTRLTYYDDWIKEHMANN